MTGKTNVLLVVRHIVVAIGFVYLLTSPVKSQTVDLSYIYKAPAIKQNAIKELNKHRGDHGPDFIAARSEYCSKLEVILNQLIKRYYREEDFPNSTVESVGFFATFKVNIRYPKTVSQGASGYDELLIEEKINELDVLISQMVRFITNESWDWNSGTKQKFDYTKWLSEWKNM